LAWLRRPRALTIEEIENLIHRFARTAELAMKAGFDGVQIHGKLLYNIYSIDFRNNNAQN